MKWTVPTAAPPRGPSQAVIPPLQVQGLVRDDVEHARVPDAESARLTVHVGNSVTVGAQAPSTGRTRGPRRTARSRGVGPDRTQPIPCPLRLDLSSLPAPPLRPSTDHGDHRHPVGEHFTSAVAIPRRNGIDQSTADRGAHRRRDHPAADRPGLPVGLLPHRRRTLVTNLSYDPTGAYGTFVGVQPQPGAVDHRSRGARSTRRSTTTPQHDRYRQPGPSRANVGSAHHLAPARASRWTRSSSTWRARCCLPARQDSHSKGCSTDFASSNTLPHRQRQRDALPALYQAGPDADGRRSSVAQLTYRLSGRRRSDSADGDGSPRSRRSRSSVPPGESRGQPGTGLLPR